MGCVNLKLVSLAVGYFKFVIYTLLIIKKITQGGSTVTFLDHNGGSQAIIVSLWPTLSTIAFITAHTFFVGLLIMGTHMRNACCLNAYNIFTLIYVSLLVLNLLIHQGNYSYVIPVIGFEICCLVATIRHKKEIESLPTQQADFNDLMTMISTSL